ncbi:cell division protein [Carbonactinospora thermoautotrophica]|uniref:FtsW/RodA/SpoVE family cell cycle protein n=1 Tax=Carbonactinospora thermoautotrophica TaxID=1469144 RepID=UPI00226DDE4A|nr:FtsW/RodA/SpoVE family cell cycle protein [Carbonactinospora thermoautotrophica]MCX9191979.1 cell division protein [Carbonactinospora thermoautotrophica]
MSSATATVIPQVTRSRRNVELLLLVFAVVIPAAAYANVGLAVAGEIPSGMWGYTAGLGLLVLVAHLVLRRFAKYADPLLLPLVTLVNGLGLVVIHRVDLALIATGKSKSAVAPTQLLWTAIGIAFFTAVVVAVKDHRTLQRYTYTAGAAGLALLALPAFLPNSEINGAKLWVRIGGFSIQPGEFAKILLMIFFAGYLVVKRDALALAGKRILGVDLPRGRDLGPILVAWGLGLLILVFEKDLGTSLLFYGSFVALLYISTERISWLLLGGLLFLSGAYFAYLIFGHVQVRVESWLDPFSDPGGSTFQILHSLMGLAWGGVTGTGLGQGHVEYQGIYGRSDFIIAAYGEELGLAGLMALLLIYALVVERGFRTAVGCRDPFGKLLAAGFAVILSLQVFVVVGGVTKLIPLTGLTTPFMAAGGSSLVANWAIIGLLLRISDHARRPAPETTPPTSPDDEKTQVVRL